jgi:hypothetical protein
MAHDKNSLMDLLLLFQLAFSPGLVFDSVPDVEFFALVSYANPTDSSFYYHLQQDFLFKRGLKIPLQPTQNVYEGVDHLRRYELGIDKVLLANMAVGRTGCKLYVHFMQKRKYPLFSEKDKELMSTSFMSGYERDAKYGDPDGPEYSLTEVFSDDPSCRRIFSVLDNGLGTILNTVGIVDPWTGEEY